MLSAQISSCSSLQARQTDLRVGFGRDHLNAQFNMWRARMFARCDVACTCSSHSHWTISFVAVVGAPSPLVELKRWMEAEPTSIGPLPPACICCVHPVSIHLLYFFLYRFLSSIICERLVFATGGSAYPFKKLNLFPSVGARSSFRFFHSIVFILSFFIAYMLPLFEWCARWTSYVRFRWRAPPVWWRFHTPSSDYTYYIHT